MATRKSRIEQTHNSQSKTVACVFSAYHAVKRSSFVMNSSQSSSSLAPDQALVTHRLFADALWAEANEAVLVPMCFRPCMSSVIISREGGVGAIENIDDLEPLAPRVRAVPRSVTVPVHYSEHAAYSNLPGPSFVRAHASDVDNPLIGRGSAMSWVDHNSMHRAADISNLGAPGPFWNPERGGVLVNIHAGVDTAQVAPG